jgi:hypothetical protein
MYRPKISFNTHIFDINDLQNNSSMATLFDSYHSTASGLIDSYAIELTMNPTIRRCQEPSLEVLYGYRAVFGLLGKDDLVEFHLNYLPWVDYDLDPFLVEQSDEKKRIREKCTNYHKFSVTECLKHQSDMIKKMVSIASDPQRRISPRKMMKLAFY